MVCLKKIEMKDNVGRTKKKKKKKKSRLDLDGIH